MRRLMTARADSYLIEPRELARHEGVWRGRMAIAVFERLAAILATDAGAVYVDVGLSIDEDDRCRCQGSARFTAEIECHRCLDAVATEVTATIDAFIVHSDAEAAALMPEHDVLIVARGKVPVARLVEDDLILALPEDVCDAGADCDNAPATRYPSNVETDEQAPSDHPFAALAALKARH